MAIMGFIGRQDSFRRLGAGRLSGQAETESEGAKGWAFSGVSRQLFRGLPARPHIKQPIGLFSGRSESKGELSRTFCETKSTIHTHTE